MLRQPAANLGHHFEEGSNQSEYRVIPKAGASFASLQGDKSKRSAKRMEPIKKKVRKSVAGTVSKVRKYIRSLDEEQNEGEHDYSKDDFAYPWLNARFLSVLREAHAWKKPSYAWGVVHGAHLASRLDVKKISILEFGVAGGNGLVTLENVGKKVEEIFGLSIDVYGFDTGKGLPEPRDYRDMPNLYRKAAFPMDPEKLRRRLKRARLQLGLVRETVTEFIRSRPAPVAFFAIDLDYYSSTLDALKLLDADARLLLPRVHCYFDDVMGFTNCDFNGERLAITDFNRAHEKQKISPIYGLKHFLPPRYANAQWVEEMYMAHLFDHPSYCRDDGLVRRPFSGGTELRDDP
jgi:hypothetical protein